MNPERDKLDGLDGDQDRAAVVVHGLDDLRRAVAVAQRVRRRSLLAVSSADAACFLGPAWWLALIRHAASEAHDLRLHDLLDCGDAAGRAMETLRLGGRGLILDAGCRQRDAVLERAAPLGARVLERRPTALDLGDRGAERRLEAWLAPGAPGDKAGPVG